MPGLNVTVTLDTAIQTKVQAVLAETVRRSGAAGATGIVLDPSTGNILALATAPGYDREFTANARGFRRIRYGRIHRL